MDALDKVKKSTDVIQRCLLRANELVAEFPSISGDGRRAELKVNLYKIQREFTNVLLYMPHSNCSHATAPQPEPYSPQPVHSDRSTPNHLLQFAGSYGATEIIPSPNPQTPVSNLTTDSSSEGEDTNSAAAQISPQQNSERDSATSDNTSEQELWGNATPSPHPVGAAANIGEAATLHDLPESSTEQPMCPITVDTTAANSTPTSGTAAIGHQTPGTPLTDEIFADRQTSETTPTAPDGTPMVVESPHDNRSNPTTVKKQARNGEPAIDDPPVVPTRNLQARTAHPEPTTATVTRDIMAAIDHNTDAPSIGETVQPVFAMETDFPPLGSTPPSKPAAVRKRGSPNSDSTTASQVAAIFDQNTDIIVGRLSKTEDVAKAIESVDISRNSSALEIDTATSSTGGDMSPAMSNDGSPEQEPNPKRSRGVQSPTEDQLSPLDTGLQRCEIDGVQHVVIKPYSVLSMNFDREQFIRGVTSSNSAAALAYFTTTGLAKATKDKTIDREAAWIQMGQDPKACLARAKTLNSMDEQQQRDVLLPAVAAMIHHRRSNEPDFDAAYDTLFKIPNIKNLRIFHEGSHSFFDCSSPQSGLNIVGETFSAYINSSIIPRLDFFKSIPEFRGRHLLILGSQGRTIIPMENPRNTEIMYVKGLMADSFNPQISTVKQLDDFDNKSAISQFTSITCHMPEAHVGQSPQETITAYRALYNKLRGLNRRASILFTGPAHLIPSMPIKLPPHAAVAETRRAIQNVVTSAGDTQLRFLDMTPYFRQHEVTRLYKCPAVPYYYNKLGVLRLISAIRENIPQMRATINESQGQ